jgi:hypothetical protein
VNIGALVYGVLAQSSTWPGHAHPTPPGTSTTAMVLTTVIVIGLGLGVHVDRQTVRPRHCAGWGCVEGESLRACDPGTDKVPGFRETEKKHQKENSA